MFVSRLLLDSPSRLWLEISPEICLEIMPDDKERRSSYFEARFEMVSREKGGGGGGGGKYPVNPRFS